MRMRPGWIISEKSISREYVYFVPESMERGFVLKCYGLENEDLPLLII